MEFPWNQNLWLLVQNLGLRPGKSQPTRSPSGERSRRLAGASVAPIPADPVDRYLVQIAAKLAPMPPRCIDDELSEIRTHLVEAIAALEADGMEYATAADAAIRQFGTPATLATPILDAWRRGETRADRRSFWSAAACFAVLYYAMAGLFAWAVSKFHPMAAYHEHPWFTGVMLIGGQCAATALLAAIVASYFPRKAPAAVWCVVIGSYAASYLQIVFAPPTAGVVPLPLSIRLIDAILSGTVMVLILGWPGPMAARYISRMARR